VFSIVILYRFQFDRVNRHRFMVSFFLQACFMLLKKQPSLVPSSLLFSLPNENMLTRDPRAKGCFSTENMQTVAHALHCTCLFLDKRLMPARDHLTQTQQRQSISATTTSPAAKKKKNRNINFDFSHNLTLQSTFLNVNCAVVGTLPETTTKVTLVNTRHNHQLIQINHALDPSQN